MKRGSRQSNQSNQMQRFHTQQGILRNIWNLCVTSNPRVHPNDAAVDEPVYSNLLRYGISSLTAVWNFAPQSGVYWLDG